MSELHHIHYEQNPDASSDFERREPVQGSVEAIEQNKRYAYELLRSTIGIETPDIPLDAIHGYFEALGLMPPPLVAFEATEESLRQIEGVAFTAAQHLRDEHTRGFYANNIDVALIANDQLRSGSNKTGMAVHEMSHGTGLKAYRIIRNSPSSFKYEPSRAGYLVKSPDRKSIRNHLLEEGRAEMIAGQFLARQYPEKEAEGSARVDDLWIPSSYISTGPDGKEMMSHAAPAAITLELLIAKRPELLSVIIERPTTVEGLRKTASEINSIAPGLYLQLGVVPYEAKEFSAAAKLVIDTLYDGDENAPLRAHEYVKVIMEDMIERQS